MPTYQYACTECGERLEVVQSFSDDPLTVCPSCAGRLRKVFAPVGVVFKGSGFYKTDSRSSTKPAAATGSTSAATKSESSESTPAPAAGESAPAAASEPAPSSPKTGGEKVA